FFLPHAPTPGLSTLSLHDALPISGRGLSVTAAAAGLDLDQVAGREAEAFLLLDRARLIGFAAHDSETPGLRGLATLHAPGGKLGDRKSTRLNSSHSQISYAVFCLK